MRLETVSWLDAKEYFSRKNTVVISVGSIENHGAHCALGTDYLVPDRLIDMANARLDILFTPVMPFGSADHHMAYPGTISLGDEVLYSVIKAISQSLYAHGARKFVFLNGHGGNTPAILRVGMEMNKLGGLCAVLNWWQIAPALNPNWIGGHGGAQETSAVMAINTGYVNLNRAEETELLDLSETLKANALGTVLFKGVSIPVPRSMEKVSIPGWSGPDNPKNASVKWGNEMLEDVASFIAEFITEFEKVDI